MNPSARRPQPIRQTTFMQELARRLVAVGLTPNQVSVLSLVFSMFAAAAIVEALSSSQPSVRVVMSLAAAAGIGLRLLCNLIDGIMAVEQHRRLPVGDLYNEVPDRLSDALVLVAVGYALAPTPFTIELGWLAALGAVLTAFVRVLGASLHPQGSTFAGPMAKPARMFTLIGALILNALEREIAGTHLILTGALIAIAVGSLMTVYRRLRIIAGVLSQASR